MFHRPHKIIFSEKDTQKYGNADGRNILYKDGLEKAFPYFLYVLKTMKLFLSQVSSGTYVSYRQLDISFILR